MGAPSRRARKVRVANEFQVAALQQRLAAPLGTTGAYAWTLEDIVDARNQQMLANFRRPAALAESFRTDDALFVAYENRLAPLRCIQVGIKPAKGARATAIASEGDALFGQEGVAISPGTLADVVGCLVNHGVAFAVAHAFPREDGSRVDVLMSYWPIEFVRWNAIGRRFETQVEGGGYVPITHGDGRWIIFTKAEHEPWKHGALLSAALVWARHAFANRDWAKGSIAHGNAKIVGEMPEGVPLQVSEGDGAGGLTAEAAAFLELLKSMATSDLPIGIRPAGSKTEVVANTSTAWQVWKELVANAEKAAARIYLGTDGVLGAQGGAPGVDIGALFGVASTLVQGDLLAVTRGIRTGLIEPWAAINFGDSTLAPSRVYQIADDDADAEASSVATRRTAFFADIAAMRAQGFVVDQAVVNAVAASYRVDAPLLATLPATAPATAPATTRPTP